MSDYYKRKISLAEMRAAHVRHPRHERHGSAPISGQYRSASSVTTSLKPTSSSSNRPPKTFIRVQVPDRVPTPMDFSTFKESGELSDITVSVDGKDFSLHKFPLYTRSDFFRALARSESGKVVLDEFPGGADTFEMVATFCYNKKIDVSKENICKLRCAAEFLQMCSPGNLADCADRYLLDVLTTARLSRDMGAIVDLLLRCRSLGAIAEQANIVEKCVNGIVDCWLLSSKWTRRLPSDRIITDSPNCQRLCKLPLSWFKQLLLAAREKNVRPSVLAKLVQMYISSKIQPEPKKEDKSEQKPNEKSEDQESGEESSDTNKQTGTPVDPKADDNKSTDAEKDAKEDDATTDAKETENKETDKPKEEPEKSTDEEDSEDDATEDVDIGVILDTLLLELPENTPLTDTIEPQWAAAMLKIADEHKCQCRPLLLKLASHLIYRFTSENLGDMSPDMLQEVVREASKDPVQVDPDTVCSVVDGYLLELAERDKLDVDIFNKMADSVPKDHRQNHDKLFKVLEKLLKSDNPKLPDDQKEALLDTVDFRKLSEAALQDAYDSKLVPDPYVTRAALALCAKLRSELDKARDIIRSQEEELDRFGLAGGRASSWLHGVESEFGLVASPSVPRQDVYKPEEVTSSYYKEEPYLEEVQYSPPGADPILEKALGGPYYADPFNVDSVYPYEYRRVSRRPYYDDLDYGIDVSESYRRSLEPSPYRFTYRSSSHRLSKW